MTTDERASSGVVQWEYRFIPDPGQEMQGFLDLLNQAGSEGWEVLHIGQWGAYAKRVWSSRGSGIFCAHCDTRIDVLKNGECPCWEDRS